MVGHALNLLVRLFRLALHRLKQRAEGSLREGCAYLVDNLGEKLGVGRLEHAHELLLADGVAVRPLGGRDVVKLGYQLLALLDLRV